MAQLRTTTNSLDEGQYPANSIKACNSVTHSLTVLWMKSNGAHWKCSILLPMALESVLPRLEFVVQIKIFDRHSALH
jgi:hypothetical protein